MMSAWRASMSARVCLAAAVSIMIPCSKGIVSSEAYVASDEIKKLVLWTGMI
jgi:hypothetical protein